MKISKLLIISVVGLSLAACNKGGGGGGGPAVEPDGHELLEPLMGELEKSLQLPSAGDRIKLTYTTGYEPNDQTYCDYDVTADEVYKTSNDSIIEWEITRDSKAWSTNSTLCPAKAPNVKSDVYKSEPKSYLAATLRDIQKAIVPVDYLKNTDWMATAKVVSSEEISHMGIRTQKVVLKLVSKKGNKYTRTVYIAKDSAMAGVFNRYLTRDSDLTSDSYLLPMAIYSAQPKIQLGSF